MNPSDAIERESVAWKNQQELLVLMREHNLFIRAAEFANWRPTVRNSGDIPGVWNNATIIATDGLLGYFLLGEGEGGCVIGHIQKFTGEVKTLFGKQPPIKMKDGAKKKKRGLSSLERAAELLQSLKPKE